MNRQEFVTNVTQLFEQHSKGQYSGRLFSPVERATFLNDVAGLWDKASIDIAPFDLQSTPAVNAMIKAARLFDSMQEQLSHFPQYYLDAVQLEKGRKI